MYNSVRGTNGRVRAKRKHVKKKPNDKKRYTSDCKMLKRKLNQIIKLLDRNPEKQELRSTFYKTQTIQKAS